MSIDLETVLHSMCHDEGWPFDTPLNPYVIEDEKVEVAIDGIEYIVHEIPSLKLEVGYSSKDHYDSNNGHRYEHRIVRVKDTEALIASGRCRT